jgi:hypothetical protein
MVIGHCFAAIDYVLSGVVYSVRGGIYLLTFTKNVFRR